MALLDVTNSSPPRVSDISGSKIALSLTLSVLAVLTIAMNSLVITAIVVTRKLHHPANYLIGSLAATDLLVAMLVMPFSIIYLAQEKWLMGQLVCDLWLAVDITCCTCSILHLAAIAVDRYWAITDAVEYSLKRTPTRAAIMIVCVWVLSVLISLPPVIWRQHENNNKTGDVMEPHVCLIKHSIGLAIYSTFGAFYIPLLLILMLYYRIYHAAKSLYDKRGASRRVAKQADNGHPLPKSTDREPQKLDTLSPPEKSFSDLSTEGERVHITPKSSHCALCRKRSMGRRLRISVSREKKAATTLGLILGAFIICWLPFFVQEVIVNTCGRPCQPPGTLANLLTWLGYLNSLINPLIYTIFNEDFKKAFQKLIGCNI